LIYLLVIKLLPELKPLQDLVSENLTGSCNMFVKEWGLIRRTSLKA